jgi:transcriptional regulator of acetoin/glycerol metabolism
LTDGESIARSDLPKHLQADLEARDCLAETFEEILRQFKIDLANRAVAECDGNKTLAARKLNVSRAYLHRLIRKPPEPIKGAA